MDELYRKHLLDILSELSRGQCDSTKLRQLIERENPDKGVSDAVSELFNAIEASRQDAALYRNVISTAVDAIIVIDEEGVVQSCNAATTALLGYESEELLGKNVKMLMPKTIADEHDSYIDNHLKTGINKVIGSGREVQGKKKNNEPIDLFLSVSKIHLKEQTLFTGILRDITKQKQAQRQAELVETKNRAIVDTAVDAIIVINSRGTIQSINQATKDLFGFEEKDLIGSNVAMLTPEPIRSEHDTYLDNYLTTGNRKVIGIGRDVTAQKKDGSQFDAYLSVSEFVVSGERFFAGIVRDISDTKKQARELEAINQALTWQNERKNIINQLHTLMKTQKHASDFAGALLQFFASTFDMLVGACYKTAEDAMILIGQYALNKQQLDCRQNLSIGEGLIGEAVKQSKAVVLDHTDNNMIFADSVFGEVPLKQWHILPIKSQTTVVGAVEMALKHTADNETLELIDETLKVAGSHLESIIAQEKVMMLLEKTQSQEEELRTNNEELTAQTQALQASEENLRVQSEELRIANEELGEKMKLVEQQRLEIAAANQAIEEKAHNLEKASRYKSEFLANMSHELRTPLNSLLLLTSGLMKNEEGNLNGEQLEDLTVINKSGNTLLTLISDILDLSKVEAGKLELNQETIDISDLLISFKQEFTPLANAKGIAFKVSKQLPDNKTFSSDLLRVSQIIRNLLANAIKFTQQGHVSLSLLGTEEQLQFVVEDTGIGIAEDKIADIFLAFRQADSSTSRHYGGTGLGLTICEKLAQLLGGRIALSSSKPGKGSCFVLTLPWQLSDTLPEVVATTQDKSQITRDLSGNIPENNTHKLNISDTIPDDRFDLNEDSLSVLIIEDDEAFAKYLMRTARSKGFKCIVALNGEAGLRLAKHFMPPAIILDLGLPDMKGNELLKQLKSDLATRHIAVHVVSGYESKPELYQQGVLHFLTKPVSENELSDLFRNMEESTKKPIKQLLVVEDDKSSQHAIIRLLEHSGLAIDKADDGKSALAMLTSKHFDCVVLDYRLPDMTAVDVLKRLEQKSHAIPPIIIYTAEILEREQYRILNQFTDRFIVKGARSPERLLDEVTLFLHSVESSLKNEQRATLKRLYKKDDPLAGSSVLLVDDDLRNSFALSRQLRRQNIDVIVADSGALALEKLKQIKYVDLILMDIMMPDMDGYETMQHIRNQEPWQKIPIIALTAKAMDGDKKKCLDAGANDYLAKPIDLDKLLDTMRVWVERKNG